LKLKEFAKKHRKEILEWQVWLRKQSGKTIAEFDYATEPKVPEGKRASTKNKT
jgi:hypothetical protein